MNDQKGCGFRLFFRRRLLTTAQFHFQFAEHIGFVQLQLDLFNARGNLVKQAYDRRMIVLHGARRSGLNRQQQSRENEGRFSHG